MSDRDPDDWFSDSARQARRQPEPREDDWTLERARPEPRWRGRPLAGNPAATRAVLGAALLAALLLALWLGGVFGGGGRPATATQQTTTAQQTTPTTTAAQAPHVPLPTGPLTPGSSGAQVKVLQRALAAAGYSPGAIDGDYGPATVNAVMKLQRANGLQPDGAFGPKTLQALQTALSP